MNCENMDNGERPTVLFIFAYQILMKLMNLRMKATPGKGGDSRKKKKRAGTLAKEKKIWLGLQQKKRFMWPGLRQLNDDMVGTPTRKGQGLQQCTGLRIS